MLMVLDKLFSEHQYRLMKALKKSLKLLQVQPGVTALDCSKGHIFYKTGCTGDITANFTNLTLSPRICNKLNSNNNQGGTSYEITAVQIGGAGQGKVVPSQEMQTELTHPIYNTK